MENWKDITQEENWASKARLILLFFYGLASTNA
jgi:hypothetical protein